MDIEPWADAASIRQIFKDAFGSIGLPYYSPHTFRKTLVQLGEQVCRTPEEFKAWSQNLGHESPLTTFTSYGQVHVHRQGDIIKRLGVNDSIDPITLLMARLEKLEQRE